MKSQTAPALPGRPRAFDADVALERAMHVLWAKRYEGASIHYPSVIRPGLSRLQMRTCSRALYPTSSLSSSVSRKLAQHIHDAVHPPGTILDRFSRSALRPSDTHCSTLIGFIGMVRGSNPSLASTAVFVSGGHDGNVHAPRLELVVKRFPTVDSTAWRHRRLSIVR
jgi:hypothetical protein